MLTMTLKVKSFKSVLQSISKSCNSSLGLSLLKPYVKMAKHLLVNETSINSYFTLPPYSLSFLTDTVSLAARALMPSSTNVMFYSKKC